MGVIRLKKGEFHIEISYKLCFFGPPRLEENGREIAVKSRKGLALLAYLAVSGQRQERDKMAGLLWPDYDQSRARANLRSVIHKLNQTPLSAFFGSDSTTIYLAGPPEPLIDVIQFSQRLESDEAADLTEAVTLYQDEFLASFSLVDSDLFEEWATLQREHYRLQALEALDSLTSFHTEQGEYEEAERTARRQLAIDNLREPAWRQLLTALSLSGRRGEALAEYRKCREVLETELGVEPAIETQALAEEIRAGQLIPGDLAQPAEARPAGLSRHRRAQLVLLEKVRQFWIRDVLENSLHGAALIDLGLEMRSGAVAYPWKLVLQKPEADPETLAPETSIVEVFARSGEALLILGEPGSGKTTMLLELARHILPQAEADPAEPIPVVFNLSSWANQGGPLSDWLVDELNDKYLIPRRIGRLWVEDDELQLLLDGLDEVPFEQREACLEAINVYRQEHGLVPLAVCSRTADYEELNNRLLLDEAVSLLPLEEEQIEGYLLSGGERLAGARTALQQDETLRDMARSPLMLSVIALTYQDVSPEALPRSGTAISRGRAIFDTYVGRMFGRRGEQGPYEPEKTTGWLAWLADRLASHNQAVFQIERLQPDWLKGTSGRFIYTLVSRILAACFILFMFEMSSVVERAMGPAAAPLSVYGIEARTFGAAAVLAGLLLGLLDWGRQYWVRRQATTLAKNRRRRLLGTVIYVLIVIVIFAAVQDLALYGLLRPFHPEPDLPVLLLGTLGTNQTRVVLVAAIVFGLRDVGRPQPQDIHTVETLAWSWRRALRGALIGFLAGLAITPFFALVTGLPPEGYLIPLWDAVLWTALGMLWGGVTRGVSETKNWPNQGMRLSLRYGLLIGSAAALVYVLVAELYALVLNQIVEGAPLWYGEAPIAAVHVFSAMALWFGWLDVIYHGTLRLVATLSGAMPWRYARLLNYAADLLFLRRVGGGFIFIHPLLQEHLNQKPGKRKAATQADNWS